LINYFDIIDISNRKNLNSNARVAHDNSCSADNSFHENIAYNIHVNVLSRVTYKTFSARYYFRVVLLLRLTLLVCSMASI